MKNNIKAIETRYKGYNFRSRTEARWAVFFDFLKWDWEYEAEGYKLPSGPYLPDFFLPSESIFIEVKGKAFTAAEKQKCKELSQVEIPHMPDYTYMVFMVVGAPDYKHYSGFSNGEEFDCGIFVEKGAKFYPVDYMMDYYEDSYYQTTMAVNAARSARFEHGEAPALNNSKVSSYSPKRRYRTSSDEDIEAMWNENLQKEKALSSRGLKAAIRDVTEINRKLGFNWNGEIKLK